MTLSACHHDAIVLVHRHPRDWSVKGCHKPLFICAEMFLELRDIESRRWKMWALRGNLVDAGLPVATLSEFLLPEDVAWLESQSARVAHEWYLGDDGDITIYRGVSLGRCVEYEVKARAVRLLKLSRCIQRLLQRHPDAKIYSDFADHSVEQRVLRQFRIALHRFGAPEDGARIHSANARASQSVSAVVVGKGPPMGRAGHEGAGQRASGLPAVRFAAGRRSTGSTEPEDAGELDEVRQTSSGALRTLDGSSVAAPDRCALAGHGGQSCDSSTTDESFRGLARPRPHRDSGGRPAFSSTSSLPC